MLMLMFVGMLFALFVMGVRVLCAIRGGVFMFMRMTVIIFVGVAMFVVMTVMMFFGFVSVRMLYSVRMGVLVLFVIRVTVLMIVSVLQMHIELHAFDLGFLLASRMQMVAIELQFPEFVLKLVKINAKVEQRTDKHVAADATENIEIKCFHLL